MSRPSTASPGEFCSSNGAPTFGRADWRFGAAIALVFVVFYTGFTHARFKSTDETGVFYVTESIYERHTLEIPIHMHAHTGADGRLYSPFAVGQSVLALPLYGLAKGARALLPQSWAAALAGPRVENRMLLNALSRERISRALAPGQRAVAVSLFGGSLETFMVGLYPAILGGLLAMALFVLMRRLGVSPRSALVTTFLICACSYPAMMSVYFLRHTGETVFLVFAFVLIRDFLETGSLRALAIGCTFASLTFLIRLPAVLAGPAVGIYVVHALSKRHQIESRRWVPDVLAVALPVIACLGVHVAVNYAKWGTAIASPMVTGGLEKSESFMTSLTSFLFSPGIGIFAYSPLLLLFPWAFHAAWKRWPWECIAIGIYGLTQLLYFSNYRFWTGLWSSPGPRYLFPACVFMLVALAAWFDRGPGRWGRVAVVGLAIIGGLSQFVLVSASWFDVIASENYHAYVPAFSFLFLPEASPILASGRAVASGQIDTWLWKLAAGWPGQDPAPLSAIFLTGAWLAGSFLGGRWLWRHVDSPGRDAMAR